MGGKAGKPVDQLMRLRMLSASWADGRKERPLTEAVLNGSPDLAPGVMRTLSSFCHAMIIQDA
jgi:hypothetical protein